MEQFNEDDFRILEALGRIETIDGIDYLEGVPLPPDDDERFSDEWHSMEITVMYGPDLNGMLGHEKRTDTFQSTLTNKDMREETVRSLATGFGMVYPLGDKNYFIGLDKYPLRESHLDKVKQKLSSLLFRIQTK